MAPYQPGILAPIPIAARHLFFLATPGARPERALRALCDCVDGEQTVAGLGGSLVQALGRELLGLRVFPAHAGAGFEVPSTPAALWCWLRGAERCELVHRARRI